MRKDERKLQFWGEEEVKEVKGEVNYSLSELVVKEWEFANENKEVVRIETISKLKSLKQAFWAEDAFLLSFREAELLHEDVSKDE